MVGTFTLWQGHIPAILRDLFEKRRIAVRAGEVGTCYLAFLEGYRDALRSPRRYLVIGSLMLIIAIELILYPGAATVITVTLTAPHKVVTILFWTMHYLLLFLISFGFMYCLGLLGWVLFISGCSIRNLATAFELRIEPVHPDNCGGLALLGNFCFGLVSPLFVNAVFFSGYMFAVLSYSLDASSLVTVGLLAFLGLVYGLPLTVFTFSLPLWSIHTKMLRQRETEQDLYAGHLAALREQVQALLRDNQVEAAKSVKEKRNSWRPSTSLPQPGRLMSDQSSSPLSWELAEASCSAS